MARHPVLCLHSQQYSTSMRLIPRVWEEYETVPYEILYSVGLKSRPVKTASHLRGLVGGLTCDIENGPCQTPSYEYSTLTHIM